MSSAALPFSKPCTISRHHASNAWCLTAGHLELEGGGSDVAHRNSCAFTSDRSCPASHTPHLLALQELGRCVKCVKSGCMRCGKLRTASSLNYSKAYSVAWRPKNCRHLECISDCLELLHLRVQMSNEATCMEALKWKLKKARESQAIGCANAGQKNRKGSLDATHHAVSQHPCSLTKSLVQVKPGL